MQLQLCGRDCKDRLIRNSIVAGLNSTKAYQQYISNGSSLTLNECIKICQTEDATCRQVQALHPESADCADSTSIHITATVKVGNLVRSVNYRICQLAHSSDYNVDYNNLLSQLIYFKYQADCYSNKIQMTK